MRPTKTFSQKAVTTALIAWTFCLFSFFSSTACPAPAHADDPEPSPTVTATATPDNMGGEMDDDDI